MAFPWTALPTQLLEPLLAGSVGKTHLMRCARIALGEVGAADLGLDLLATAWEHDPLDAALAGQIIAIDEQVHLLPKALKTLLHQASRAGNRLVSVQQAAAAALEEADHKALATAAADTRKVFEAGGDMLLARAHALAGRHERARAACAALSLLAPLTTVTDLHAHCAQAMGDRERATELLRSSLTLRPWQVNTLLRLADMETGADMTTRLPDGDTAILLYSWNKAEDLNATLDSLASSDTGRARILALDNASTDETPAVLEAWASRLGERLTTITMPCNLGAPAARNWLMTRPEVRSARWTVYLDDDILLPTDWLARLGAAAEAYPDATVWGCKVVDKDLPSRIQNADLHIREAQQGLPVARHLDTPPPFSMTDLHMQTPDLGQFDFMRPCASVTGCCHLFRTDRLLASGEFDIRFSPTQFDDLEHDLRMLADGGGAVYTGHLRVRHARRTGDTQQQDATTASNAVANMIKLYYKIDHDTASIRSLAASRLVNDVVKREQALGV